MLYAQDPKKKRTKRILTHREPKEHENEKRALVLNGNKVSADLKIVLTEITAMKKPSVIRFSKKNDMRPFEDASGLEFLALKNDASLFALGSHTKKRPHNLIMGRMFDFRMLDMIEMGLSNVRSMTSFGGQRTPGIGMKPCFVFQGEQFMLDKQYGKLANVFLDFFRGRRVELVDLKGLEHVIVLSAMPSGEVLFRHYAIVLQRSGTRIPRVELEEVGPSFDIRIRRTQFGAEDLQRTAARATKKSNPALKKVRKNISSDDLGTRLGTVHMQSQDLNNLVTARPKALKRNRATKSATGKKTESRPRRKKSGQ